MAKITLPSISSGYATTTQLNNAFTQLEDELQDKVLYRDNPSGEPNTMENDLDMNSNSIQNVDDLECNTISVGGTSLTAQVAAAAASATSAANSATAASGSATSAASSAASAATIYDNFDDRYLGQKSSAPSVDNDGNTLLTGALYFNTTGSEMYVWGGSSWLSVSNTTSSTAAAASASAASTSATNAASSASSASTSASNAATSASNASTSATNAASSASSASSSASTATSAASTATTQASNASTSATNAASSASSASTSASNAASSASSASTSASSASTSASNASTSASNAASSASSASTSASNASTSATAAASAQSAAESARDATLAAYDNFDDRYLGAKAVAPTLDNDGNALVGGALYFDTVGQAMKVYTGSAWTAAYISAAGVLLASNNLSDVSNTSTARTNLGLGTAATTNSTAYATAAQGTNADTAYGWGNHASAGYASTSGSYSNPSWITSLSETKVLPSQSTNSGKYLTTNGTSTSWATVDALPSQTGNNGKYLTTDGSAASWATLAVGASAGGVIWENDVTVSQNYTLATNKNGLSVGPITIASGYAVTVPSGQRWYIL